MEDVVGSKVVQHSEWWTVILTAIGLVGATIMATYAVFETQDRARERAALLSQRLDRIENKLDALIDRGR